MGYGPHFNRSDMQTGRLQFLARKNDGFRKRSTHPTDCDR